MSRRPYEETKWAASSVVEKLYLENASAARKMGATITWVYNTLLALFFRMVRDNIVSNVLDNGDQSPASGSPLSSDTVRFGR